MVDLSQLTRRQWLTAAGLTGLAGCGKPVTNEPIWIGHLARLSGAERDGGEMAINAMQLTLADLRANEVTIAGRPIGVRHADAPTKERARAEASRLLAVNRAICLVVSPGVPDVSGIVAIGRSHGAAVVVLGEVADSTLADQAVLLGADPQDLGERLARHAASDRKKPRAFLLRDPKEKIAEVVVDGFTREFSRVGGEFTVEDLETTLLKGTKNPFAEGRLMQDTSLPIIYVGPLREEPKWLLKIPQGLEFWWPTLSPDPASLSADSKGWVERFAKRFGKQPAGDALLAHDAIAVIADALQTIDSDDQGKLMKELAGRTAFAGLTGTISRKEGRPIRPLFLTRVVKGRRLPTVALPS